MKNRAPLFLIAAVLSMGLFVNRGLAASSASSAAPAAKVTLAKFVKALVEKTLSAAEQTKDFDAAGTSLGTLFDQVVGYARENDLDTVREADFALRMVNELRDVPSDQQVDDLHFLRANPELAHALVFLITPKQKPVEVFAVLQQLREKRAAQLEKYANLTAAICVVHARPLVRHINENTAKAAEPGEIFDYYVKNEGRMFFGVKAVPAELLVWVVDTTASIDDMNWALAKYAGDKKVGGRFFDIKYDYDNFEKGTPKKITSAGFTLPNILQYGGVCADQAYFAMSVGKAIGVPTAYTVGASGEAGHAWVGFLQADHGKGWWNFDVGRYSAYRGVRGNVQDPQTREEVPDSLVSVQAELIGTRASDRQAAAALTDAAARLIDLEKAGQPWEIPPFPSDVTVTAILPKPRKAATADALALIELALKQSVGYAPAWFSVRDLAKDGKLDIKDKMRWADVLQRLGGPKYPDFTLSVLTPMIETVTDAKQQDALWNAAFNMFQSRFDLAASIRMEQAAAWEAQNNTVNAGACYMDVIERYANAGPFVIEALKKAEQLLKDSKRGDKVVRLYEQTWKKIEQPREMYAGFMVQSNWYRVGMLYSKKLAESGDTAGAQRVADEIKNPPAKPTGTSK